MASLTEDSIPPDHIADLEAIQKRLLEDREPNADAPTPEPQQESNSYHNDASEQLPSTVQESANGLPSPDSSPVSKKATPARLHASKSAPGDMEAMVVGSTPSVEAFNDFTKAKSFHAGDVAEPDSDTQEMPSQVYHKYTESMVKASMTADANATATPQKQQDSFPMQEPETYRTDFSDKTPRTVQEGETGHINLFDAFVPSSSPMRETQAEDDVYLEPEPQETQSPEEFRKPARPSDPQTPAHGLAGQKHGRDGEPLTSSKSTTTKTPGFSQLFGHRSNALIDGSQLFKQTQTHSSPPPGFPRSSPTLTRPSPNNLHHEDSRETQSLYGFSSPPAPLTDTTPRPSSFATGEPRTHYRSTKESQAEREARRAARDLARFEDGRANNFDTNELSWEARPNPRRLPRSLSDRTLNLKAPARPIRARPSSSREQRETVLGRSETIDLTETPAPHRHHGRHSRSDPVDEELDLLEDDQEQPELPEEVEDEDDEELDEPTADEDSDSDGLEEVNDNDEYDEFGQTLRSQANDPDDYDENGSVAEHEGHEDVEMEDGEEEIEATSKSADTNLPAQRTQGSTVADSQPTAQQAPHERPPTQQVLHSSYVPGSQYEGKTSEDQVILASSQRRSQNRVAASQMNKEESRDSNRMPSSPPLQPVQETVPKDSAEASLQRRALLKDFQGRRHSSDEDAALPREIPESDVPEAEAVPAVEEESQGSNFAAPYSTARTHVSGSAQSPGKRSVAVSPAKHSESQRSSLIDPSPRKQAGVRHFSQMNGLSRTTSSFDVNEDLDTVVSGLIDADDREFLAVTSDTPEQPRSKRRRLNNKEVSSNITASETNSAVPSTHVTSDVDMQDRSNVVDETKTAAADPEPDLTPPEEQPEALKDSPSKGNEMPPTSTPEDVKEVRDESPESRRQREKAGADAASQLISARGAKAAKAAKKTKQVTYGRTTKREAAKNETAASKKSAATKASKANEAVDENIDDTINQEPQVPRTESDVSKGDGDTEAAVQVEETTEVEVEPTEQSADAMESHDTSMADVVPSAGALEANGDGTIVAPNRILAHFRGTPPNYYPATWVGGSADGTKYKIRFDDGNVTEVYIDQVCLLDIHIGDNFRVDDPKMRKKTWTVVGFCEVVSAAEQRKQGVDVYGHARVKVQAKPGRESTGNEEIHEVQIEQLYLSGTMWPQYYNRAFKPTATARPTTAVRAETPSTRSGTPNSETPSSRSRRGALPTVKGRGRAGRPSHLREVSVASSDILPLASPAAIFTGMAFAITYVGNEAEKANVSRLIERNGGIILQDGFEQLFELPNVGDDGSRPGKKKSPRKAKDDAEEELGSGLQLKAEYEGIGFVALIADRHSRRAKYMQALALGLPTLSGRWVIDSLDTAKNKTLRNGEVTPLAWDRYLLPAGESSYLGRAIRSRTITNYEARSADLPNTVATRPILLDGESVLIVAPKKGKTGWEKRKTYAFLTLALGARQVKRVNDLQEAKTLMQENPDTPKWVYVDGAVAEAEKILFGKAGGGKKRKRESDAAAVKVEEGVKMSANDGNVRIVNDEFVVQSLILGALTE